MAPIEKMEEKKDILIPELAPIEKAKVSNEVSIPELAPLDEVHYQQPVKTNTTKNEFHGGPNPNLLNGPADNPTASCLSCHGAAGTTTRMVPGVRDFAHYRAIRAKGTLDFSMQLAFAKRNYETRPQMTK